MLLKTAAGTVEDKVWRAYELVALARSLSFEETMNLLSGVRSCRVDSDHRAKCIYPHQASHPHATRASGGDGGTAAQRLRRARHAGIVGAAAAGRRDHLRQERR